MNFSKILVKHVYKEFLFFLRTGFFIGFELDFDIEFQDFSGLFE